MGLLRKLHCKNDIFGSDGLMSGVKTLMFFSTTFGFFPLYFLALNLVIKAFEINLKVEGPTINRGNHILEEGLVIGRC